MEQLNPPADLPKPISVILNNRAKLAEMAGKERALYTPPAPEHYPHLYPWDSSAAAIILDHFGYSREAETEVFSIFHRQRPDGMVPNMQRLHGYRNLDPELLTFTQPEISSDYSQPTIWIRAIDDVYQSKKVRDPEQAKLFLDGILPKAKESLRYFIDNRQISVANPLIFNTAPQETGRDFDESLNGYARKLPRSGPETPRSTDLINAGVGYMGRLALGARNKLSNWDPQQIRQYYAAVDPMFNSIYAWSLGIVGNLAAELEEQSETEYFHDMANAVEEKILTNLWEPEAKEGNGAFLTHNVKGTSEVVSISALGPLLLRKLKEHQLQSVLDLMDSSFNTPFSLPTIDTNSPHYDPEGHQPHHVWVGEVMMIANWLAVIGLRAQATRTILDLAHRPDLTRRSLHWSEHRIIPTSKAMLEQGYFEGYSPETGLPKRMGTVKDFVWDGLIETL